MPDIIDTANNVTGHLRALKNAGVHTVIRYDDRMKAGDWKQIHTAEARAIANAGLMLGIVYEHGAKPSGEKQGYRDAAYSRRMTQTRGQPSGSAIYFAVDHDASRLEIRNDILPYFKGVYRAFGKTSNLPNLRVGVYCSGLVAEALREAHPDILIWITCSLGFARSRIWVRNKLYDLWQTKCDVHFSGLDCDFNSANRLDWGAFMPWGGTPQSPSTPPKISS